MEPSRKYNGGQWTFSRYQSFVKSALRAASRRWPPKFETLNDSCVGQMTNVKTGRLAKHYTCAKCLNVFPAKDVQVDHIDAIINPSVGFTTWDDVVNNMFCESSNLQTLCLTCHKTKTAEERQLSKERKSK